MLCFPSFLTITYHFPWCFCMFPLVFLRFRWVILLIPLNISPVSYFRFCGSRFPAFNFLSFSSAFLCISSTFFLSLSVCFFVCYLSFLLPSIFLLWLSLFIIYFLFLLLSFYLSCTSFLVFFFFLYLRFFYYISELSTNQLPPAFSAYFSTFFFFFFFFYSVRFSTLFNVLVLDFNYCKLSFFFSINLCYLFPLSLAIFFTKCELFSFFTLQHMLCSVFWFCT